MTPGHGNGIEQAVVPMPEGFTDRAAWDAIHWRFSPNGSALDTAVIAWQRENQERVKAAIRIRFREPSAAPAVAGTRWPRSGCHSDDLEGRSNRHGGSR